MEEWRDIPGLEGRYQVSNDGRIRSVERFFDTGGRGTRTIRSQVKKPRTTNQSYFFVMIWIGCAYKRFYIHRCVALAFIPNPEGKEIVNHLDRNRQNNDLSNLEWATASENVRHWQEDERQKKSLIETPILARDLPW